MILSTATFDWDEGNLSHIARHQVTATEVQEALIDRFCTLETSEARHGALRYNVTGETVDGRVLTVIFEIRRNAIRTVTSYTATVKSKRPTGQGGTMSTRLPYPEFATETDEADWLHEHREDLDLYFSPANASLRTLLQGAYGLVLPEAILSVPLSTDDLARANTLAAERGLTASEFIGQVVHESLRTRQAASS